MMATTNGTRKWRLLLAVFVVVVGAVVWVASAIADMNARLSAVERAISHLNQLRADVQFIRGRMEAKEDK